MPLGRGGAKGQTQGQAASRPARGDPRSRRVRLARGRPRQAGREQPLPGDHLPRPRTGDAAQDAPGQGGRRRLQAVDRDGRARPARRPLGQGRGQADQLRRGAEVLGVPQAKRTDVAEGASRRLAKGGSRLFHSRPARGKPTSPCPRRSQAHAYSPRDLRPDRPPAHDGGDRRLYRRSIARCLSQSRRSAAGFAALRRKMGTPLARRRALCR